MKKNNKGFTLIELLAVIVILGLLMAIAIPSITKYITQSRVKTLVSTIDSYVTTVVTQVNDGEYRFTDSTKIFAIPIECISLEKGGTDPFGNWMQANKDYWAYVLVHYDNINYNYEYGFTFKDDAGYGLYPTLIDKIENNMVRTGYDDLTQPQDGPALNFVMIDKWEGFSNITTSTNLVVLEASSENEEGDRQNTCTLCRKGDNYEAVEDNKKAFINDRTIMATTDNSTTAFWGYKEQIKTITFENNINIPNNAYKSWDVSSTGNGKVIAYIKENTSNSSYYDLYIQGDGQLYANRNSSYLFDGFIYVDNIYNIDILNTKNVTNMKYMFAYVGYKSEIIKLDLGNNFNTSNVTNMNYMFGWAGNKSKVFTLNLGDKFDTSKVTNMQYMFYYMGANSLSLKLDLGNKFDTSNVTNMGGMFVYVGFSNKDFKLNLGNKFDTKNVTNMDLMFGSTGRASTVLSIDCSNWNVDKVTSHTSFNANVETKIIAPVWKN